jgi:MSHA biogenesis protein MshN
MSLINKMLQDLDARGGGGEAALDEQVLKAVPAAERDRRPLMMAGAGAAVLVLAAGGWYGWQYWKNHSAPAGPVPKVIDNRVPDRPRLQEPAAAATAAVAPAVAMPEVPVAAIKPAEDHAGAEAVPQSKPKRAAPAVHADAVDEAAPVPVQPRPRKSAAAANTVAPRAAVSDLTPKQVAENTYRRALASLQEGRVSSAMADLDKALEIDPRNDAARQTYVSLLLENKRTDDAIRQLRLALGIDPGQPGLAMVLARLQLEKGGPALQTLLTTLPYAGDSAEYRGFLAGVLQREHRNDEAAQHYRDALRLSPNNGVWWMGLGISLQAGQHLPEARDAYTRARAAAGLTPELQSFIDRKLEQLSR